MNLGFWVPESFRRSPDQSTFLDFHTKFQSNRTQ